MQQADHAFGLAHVGRDLLDGCLLARREIEGQGSEHGLAQAAIALRGVPRERAIVVTHQGNRELARQQFVESKPCPRRMHRRQVAFFRWCVGMGEGAVPALPALLGKVGGVLPFGQLRCPFDGRGDGLLHGSLSEAGRQPIDRLDSQDGLALVQRHHMVGVRHLHLALVDLDLAAHHAGFAGRQQLPEVILAAVEVGEAETPGLVAAPDAVGLAWAVRHQMLVDDDGERGDLSRLGSGDVRGVAPVDHGEWQMPQQVHYQWPCKFLHELAQPRADAGQRGDLGEERGETLRAHG